MTSTTALKTYYAANLINNQIDVLFAVDMSSSGALIMTDGSWHHPSFSCYQFFKTWKSARSWMVKQRRTQIEALRTQMHLLQIQLDVALDLERPV